MDDAQAYQLFSTAPEGWRVIANAVPTRAFRILADDTDLKFRIEQLDASQAHHGVYDWRPIAVHVGDFTFEAYPPAIKDMLTKQVKFKELVKLAEHNDNMAMLAAQNAMGGNT